MRDKFNQEIELGDSILYNNIKYYVVLDTILGVTGYYLDDCKNSRIPMFNIQPEELEKKENITKYRTPVIHWIVT